MKLFIDDVSMLIGLLDLLQEPATITNSAVVQCCCWTSGEVSATVRMNKRCFVPGETIFICAEIVNRSQTDISRTKAQLKQVGKIFL